MCTCLEGVVWGMGMSRTGWHGFCVAITGVSVNEVCDYARLSIYDI